MNLYKYAIVSAVLVKTTGTRAFARLRNAEMEFETMAPACMVQVKAKEETDLFVPGKLQVMPNIDVHTASDDDVVQFAMAAVKQNLLHINERRVRQ